jgi:hypothetical protein
VWVDDEHSAEDGVGNRVEWAGSKGRDGQRNDAGRNSPAVYVSYAL